MTLGLQTSRHFCLYSCYSENRQIEVSNLGSKKVRSSQQCNIVKCNIVRRVERILGHKSAC